MIVKETGITVSADLQNEGLVWLDPRTPPFSLHGVFYDGKEGQYLRMPAEAAARVSPKVAQINRETAGGRLRFRTDSPYICLSAAMQNVPPLETMPRTGQSGFDLFRDDGDGMYFYRIYKPPVDLTEGYSGSAATDGSLRDYMIHFPLCDNVHALYIGLKEGSTLEAAAPYKGTAPVVYYGSSITQGECASRPGNGYEAQIARRLDRDFINLGFAGNAKGERAIAEYIATLDMSCFVCDLDYNCQTAEFLRQVHEPLVRVVRAARPTLPIVIVSAPRSIRGEKLYTDRRAVVLETYEKLIREGDKNVWFVDGATLFAGENWDGCTADITHPNDLGYFRMARRIGDALAAVFRTH